MFYCEECRVKNDWPKSFEVKSLGKCEECGQRALCHSTRSDILADPERAKLLEAALRQDNMGEILDAIRNDDPDLENMMERFARIRLAALKEVTKDEQ